jgi:hypothetical protein
MLLKSKSHVLHLLEQVVSENINGRVAPMLKHHDVNMYGGVEVKLHKLSRTLETNSPLHSLTALHEQKESPMQFHLGRCLNELLNLIKIIRAVFKNIAILGFI